MHEFYKTADQVCHLRHSDAADAPFEERSCLFLETPEKDTQRSVVCRNQLRLSSATLRLFTGERSQKMPGESARREKRDMRFSEGPALELGGVAALLLDRPAEC